MRVLIVEDNELVADAVARGLQAGLFSVDRFATAESAYAAMQTTAYDVAIVDIGLPGEDGLDLVSRIRKSGGTLPVLILTARQSVDDKLQAFDLGADDFLVKPFNQQELLARVRALIRRATLSASGRVSIGGMEIDLAHRELLIRGQKVELTSREWAVFDFLVRHAGRIVQKDRLLQAVTSFDADFSANALEVYVSRIRSKLGDAAVIRALRGLGYRLEEPG